MESPAATSGQKVYSNIDRNVCGEGNSICKTSVTRLRPANTNTETDIWYRFEVRLGENSRNANITRRGDY